LNKICLLLNESFKKIEDIKVSDSDLKIDKDIGYLVDPRVDFEHMIFIERENIDNYCNAVKKSEFSKLKDLSSKLKKDFISLYLKYG